MLIRIKLVLVALFIGFVIVGNKIIASDVPPYSAILLRFAIATALLLILLAKRSELKHLLKPSRMQWLAFVVLAFSGVVGYNLFMLMGVQTVPATRAGILYALFPMLTWVGAWFIFKEKFTVKAMFGSLCCLAGVVLALSQGSEDFVSNLSLNIGDVFIFLSLLGWVAYALMSKWLLSSFNPLLVTTVTCLAACVLLVPFAAGEDFFTVLTTLNSTAWIVIIIQGALSTFLTFLWHCEGMESLGAGKAALFLNLMPIATIFLAVILLGEALYVMQILGMLLVCAGVVLAGQNQSRAKADADKDFEHNNARSEETEDMGKHTRATN